MRRILNWIGLNKTLCSMRHALCNLKEETMPIYEYQCRKCGNVFEKIQIGKGEEERMTCPSCGADHPEKVLSSFSSKGSESSSSCGPAGGSSRFS